MLRFETRYDVDAEPRARHRCWKRYWKHLEAIKVKPRSDLNRYFVADVFQGGAVSITSLDVEDGVAVLSLENTWAMNVLHGTRGDSWACKHIRRADFRTEARFEGVQGIAANLGPPGRHYYCHCEIAGHPKGFQMTIVISSRMENTAHISLLFGTVRVSSIKESIRRYYKDGKPTKNAILPC